jgi:ABC-2 type transport system ATP-binding protein
MSAIVVRGLVKRYGGRDVVNRLDLDVPSGSFFGIAGPNGAGKTTTLRMITGLLQPDGGAAWIAGQPVWPDPRAAKALLGYVPDSPVLFERLTGIEMLEYAGLLRRMDPREIRFRSADLLRVLGLEADAHRPIADYSLGMTKRVGLAVAILHSPRVLVLDEPFGSLDPVNTQVMVDMLQRYRSGGGTVVFSSHVMDVIQRLCDRVAIIADGRLAAEGTVAEVAGAGSLQDAFVALVGTRAIGQGELRWLSSSSS